MSTDRIHDMLLRMCGRPARDRTMQIKLSYVGYLKFDGVKSGDMVEGREGETVAELLTRYKVRPEHQRHITPFINEEEAKLSSVLKDMDELTLVIQIGGG